MPFYAAAAAAAVVHYSDSQRIDLCQFQVKCLFCRVDFNFFFFCISTLYMKECL